MNLVGVKRMNLVCRVRNTSMSVGPYLCPSYRLVIWGTLPVIDVEALLIFGELHREILGTPLQVT